MLLVAIYFSTIHFRVTKPLGVFIIISFKVNPTRSLRSHIDYKTSFYMLSKIGCLEEHTYYNKQQDSICSNVSEAQILQTRINYLNGKHVDVEGVPFT